MENSQPKNQTKEIKQIISRNLYNKALILQLDDSVFEVSIYEWEDKSVDENGNPFWTRIAGPFVIHSLEEAEKIAQENLQLFSFEIPDKSIDKALHNFVKEKIKHENYDFFKPQNFEMEFLIDSEDENFETIIPEKILYIDDFYFIENKNQWLTGFLNEKGKIRGWQKFDNLKTALDEILI